MMAPVFALLALLPLAIGGPSPSAPSFMVTFCSGTENRLVEIPVPGKQPDMPERCPAQACHAGCNRKQFDPAQ